MCRLCVTQARLREGGAYTRPRKVESREFGHLPTPTSNRTNF